MSSSDRPPKQQAFLALLKEGRTSLHLDARRAGVTVPDAFKTEAHLILQYGYDLPIPILDLEVDDSGVRSTLSFSRQPHLTVIPWSAVYVVACEDGRGVLYPEDVPADVMVIAAKGAGCEESLRETDEHLVELPPGDLAAVGGEGAMGADSIAEARPRRLHSIPAIPVAEDLAEPLAARRRRRPQLRLVK